MRADPVALILALVLGGGAGADTVEPVSLYQWDTEVVAGVSGLELDESGEAFTAVSDRGFWLTGRIERQNGALSGVLLDDVRAILGLDGMPVAARRVGDLSDAEGLAIAPDGIAWVSFERYARVFRYENGMSGRALHVADHPTFRDHADNWQLEAVALHPDGTLYAFSEKPLPEGFPIYRQRDGAWNIEGFLPERDLFAIVGADFDADGDLYLLERKLVMGFWWQSRIRRVRLDGSEDRTLWTSERGMFDNLEGLALWRDGEVLMMTAIGDNNGSIGVPTEIVDFRLVPAPLDEDQPEG